EPAGRVEIRCPRDAKSPPTSPVASNAAIHREGTRTGQRITEGPKLCLVGHVKEHPDVGSGQSSMVRTSTRPGVKERLLIETALLESQGIVGKDVAPRGVAVLRLAQEAQNVSSLEVFVGRRSQ